MSFKKNQKSIDPESSCSRQHTIPFDVREFAGLNQLSFTGSRGRGRSNVPSLADIYYQLAIEGMEILMNDEYPYVPIFQEVGKPENHVCVKIAFDSEFDLKLRKLKQLADSGEFKVIPSSPTGRKTKKISLISLAVNLMQIAVKNRKNEL